MKGQILLRQESYARLLEYERLVLSDDRSKPRNSRLAEDDCWRPIEF